MPVVPRSLDELPESRREYLLWQHALTLDYEGVEDLVIEAAERPCPWRQDLLLDVNPEGWASVRAVLGDDGRYHLLVNDNLECGAGSRRRSSPTEFAHKQWCHWWTDGTSYRVQPPPSQSPPTGAALSGRTAQRTARWTVTLTDTVTAPALVPRGERCPGGGMLWPPHHTTGTPMGRLRIRLVAEFGAVCQACRRMPVAAVDHDHRTGLVRGLLCGPCNTWIDTCPHLSACPWADYLNDPPAGQLNVRYPRLRKPSAGYVKRAEYLGFALL